VTILCVEDEQHTLDEMLAILELEYDEVHGARSGEEGLRRYDELKPDVLLCDIQMPVMDGLQMCAKIREKDPEAAIILTTAYNEPEYLEKAKALGIGCYLHKPLDIDTLFECIESLLKAK
jgi:YesN/AraC family two-component response regulator